LFQLEESARGQSFDLVACDLFCSLVRLDLILFSFTFYPPCDHVLVAETSLSYFSLICFLILTAKNPFGNMVPSIIIKLSLVFFLLLISEKRSQTCVYVCIHACVCAERETCVILKDLRSNPSHSSTTIRHPNISFTPLKLIYII